MTDEAGKLGIGIDDPMAKADIADIKESDDNEMNGSAVTPETPDTIESPKSRLELARKHLGDVLVNQFGGYTSINGENLNEILDKVFPSDKSSRTYDGMFANAIKLRDQILANGVLSEEKAKASGLSVSPAEFEGLCQVIANSDINFPDKTWHESWREEIRKDGERAKKETN